MTLPLDAHRTHRASAPSASRSKGRGGSDHLMNERCGVITPGVVRLVFLIPLGFGRETVIIQT